MRSNLLINKKATELAQQGILIMILVLAILIPLFFFVKNVYAPGIFDENSCRASVEKHANQHIIRGLDISEDIKCSTKYITIKYEDEEQIKYALAEELRKCWYQYGEGKINLFSGTDAFCAICSVINFSTDKPVNGFTKYLMDTTMPGKDISYADYLQGYSTQKTDEIKSQMKSADLEVVEDALERESLDTTKRYAIIFTYARGQDIIQEYLRHFNPFGPTETGKASVIASGAVGIGAGVSTAATTAALLIALGSNPVGWAATLGIAAGVTTFAATEFITSYFRETKPQWLSVIVMREYSAEGIEGTYCKTLPISQKKANT